MTTDKNQENLDLDHIESHEWRESLEYVMKNRGNARATEILKELETYAYSSGVEIPFSANTPYVNTIPVEKQARFPGNVELEKRIRALIRWNAMAMVVRANKEENGIGGHISTYASAATLYEVGFNHFGLIICTAEKDPNKSDNIFILV